MSRTSHSVRGELHVDGPGARRVPVRLDGRGRSLRIEVGAGWPALAKLGRRGSTRHLPGWLRRRDLSVTLSLEDRTVLELGPGYGSGVKLHLRAALRALLTVPLRDLPRVVATALDLLRAAPTPEPVPVPVRTGPRRGRGPVRG